MVFAESALLPQDPATGQAGVDIGAMTAGVVLAVGVVLLRELTGRALTLLGVTAWFAWAWFAQDAQQPTAGWVGDGRHRRGVVALAGRSPGAGSRGPGPTRYPRLNRRSEERTTSAPARTTYFSAEANCSSSANDAVPATTTPTGAEAGRLAVPSSVRARARRLPSALVYSVHVKPPAVVFAPVEASGGTAWRARPGRACRR